MKSSPRAFTLIELLICLVFIAVLAMAMFINFSRGALKARFDKEVTAITNIIEQARGYSHTSVLVGDSEPTQYYLLTVSPTGLKLEAYGATLNETIKQITFDTRFSLDTSETIYYFPPQGEICFDTSACDSGTSEITFTLKDSSGKYSQAISINAFGGYPQLSH